MLGIELHGVVGGDHRRRDGDDHQGDRQPQSDQADRVGSQAGHDLREPARLAGGASRDDAGNVAASGMEELMLTSSRF